MAPVPFEEDPSAPDLSISSLELDVRSPNPSPTTLILHTRDDTPTLSSVHDDFSFKLAKRDDSGFVPGQGTRPPESFNNNGFLALFAVIGAAMVVASLWFFFWSKNGGFKFQEGDWDDYKSTVLRRKGPDGKTLSNATKSTKLGGSTIAGTQHYRWAKQEARSVVGYDEKGRKGITAQRGWGKTHSLWSGDTSYQNETFGTQTISDMTEIRDNPSSHQHQHHSSRHHSEGHHSKRYRDRDVQDYKRERPARVGGLNRIADGSHIDTSVEGSVASSAEPILNRPGAPGRSSPAKDRDKERAERRAREEAARMERRWKKEAEEAAAALARESARAIPSPKKAAAPSSSSRPSPAKPRARSQSRSKSPRKRDVSYQRGAADAASEVLSTAYTASNSNTNASSQRTASYYDAYRPQAEPGRSYSSEYGKARRQSSPKKSSTPRAGGYRRGADSDLD